MNPTRISRRRFSQTMFGVASVMTTSAYASPPQTNSRVPSLTDVDGILVGHHTLPSRPTGCTVIISTSPFAAGVDVRGGAPGTRETDLLRPENLVERVNAIFLAGGSAFGLDVAGGISRFLEERGRGFDTPVAKVPIVCGAILFDLALGDPRIRPDAGSGYTAAQAASAAPVKEGCVGAGAGATVGKLLGSERGMKSGLGSWSWRGSDGLAVGALAAVNAVGDIVDPARGRIVAGARKADGSGFVDTMDQLRKGFRPGSPFKENTVIAAVATNAALSKSQCTRVAQMAGDALARCIYPSHTPWDGDTVFAIATGRRRGAAVEPGVVGALAADVLSTAILRAVQQAESWGPYPAMRDFPKR